MSNEKIMTICGIGTLVIVFAVVLPLVLTAWNNTVSPMLSALGG